MEKKSDIRFAMNQGLILGLIIIVIQVLTISFSLTFKTWMGLVSLAINIGLVVWTIKKFRDEENNGFLEYGKGVKIGFLSMLFAGLLLSFFLFVYFQIDTKGFGELMDEVKQKSE